MKIKGSISIGYSRASREFEFELKDVGLSESQWISFTDEEKEYHLDSVLEEELSNVLETCIWVEELNND